MCDIEAAVARLQAVAIDRAVLERRCGSSVVSATSDRVLQKVSAVQAAAGGVFGDAVLESAVTHSVYTSPMAHYRQRCRFLVLVDADDATAPVRVADFYRDKARPYTKDTLPAYPSAAIQLVLRRLIVALEGGAPRAVVSEDSVATLRDGVRGAMCLSASATGETILVLTYDRAIDDADDAWEDAATPLRAFLSTDAAAAIVVPGQVARDEVAADAALPLRVSLLGRSKGKLRVLGRSYIEETFRLPAVDVEDDDSGFFPPLELVYRQIEGSFTNPNATVAMHTLNWLRASVATIRALNGGVVTDLLELYCGGGNHTVALARCFRRVVGVEIDRKLCEVATTNLALNQCTNAAVVRTPSARFCKAMLRTSGGYLLRTMEKQGLALGSLSLPAGGSVPGATEAEADATSSPASPVTESVAEYDFETVLVDPPRAGLDATTRALVARYRYVLYISCSPLESLKRDLGELSETHALHRMAYFDHWPLHDFHFEAAVLLVRRD